MSATRRPPASRQVRARLSLAPVSFSATSIFGCRTRIIALSSLPRTSNNIIQKGLAFGREQSGTVTVPSARRAPRDSAPPATWPRWGCGGGGNDAAPTQWRIPMSRLTDTQLVILSTASRRNDRGVRFGTELSPCGLSLHYGVPICPGDGGCRAIVSILASVNGFCRTRKGSSNRSAARDDRVALTRSTTIHNHGCSAQFTKSKASA